MTREELIKKIKKIDIKASILAQEFFVGSYHSLFKGNGMEFSDVRKYEIGDDVKRIDWKTSARQRRTYVKEYVEERELSIFILVDISMSNNFSKKKDMITEIAASLSYTAEKNGDKSSLLLFTDKLEKFIPPKKGRNHVFSIIESLLNTKPSGGGTKIKLALNYLNKIQKKRAVVFLISDFLDSDYEEALKLTKKKHEVIPLRIKDRKFETLPKGFLFNLIDSETKEVLTIGNFKNDIKLQEESLDFLLDIYTDEDYFKVLSKYFKRRSRL